MKQGKKSPLSTSQMIKNSAFTVVSLIHSTAKQKFSATTCPHSTSPIKTITTQTSQPPLHTHVDTTSTSLTSFMRHKMRQFTKVEPEYVRKLMSTNVIKTQSPLHGLVTEGNIERSESPPGASPRFRPRTCATSVRFSKPILTSQSPEKPQVVLRKGFQLRKQRLDKSYERLVANCSTMMSPQKSVITNIEKARTAEKTMMKSFFGTVRMIEDIECRHVRHLPEIYYAKIESDASYLEDAQNISVEYRKGISDPSRFVGRIERKRWGRQKVKPPLIISLNKD